MSEENPTTAIPTVQIDDATTRVTEWRFPPGTTTGRHTHELPYVVVPTSDGTLTVITDDGVAHSEIRLGQSYTRPVGSTHEVRNDTDSEFAFVEVEIKRG